MEAARARFGDGICDELLLLRMMLPAEQVDAIRTADRSSPAGAVTRCAQLVEGLAARDLRRWRSTAVVQPPRAERVA